MHLDQKTPVRWNKKDTPPEVHSILETLAEEYPIRQGNGAGILVRFEKTEKPGVCHVSRSALGATISYSTPAMALRALSSLMAGLVPKGRELTENSPFLTFGIMLDCSRNAVMKVEHFKKWLRRLALFGYNMAMLYTEETYELPGEDYFGHLRGRYTPEELREIDAYANALGIEMIPCIQTLGHLEHLLKWPAYADVKDTCSVLLVGEKKTYELINKMIRHWSSVFRSRRIHIGMDETHDLGRGRFMDRNGYKRGFYLFNEHLSNVVRLCEKEGMKPMIWSDMYFRLGNSDMRYYDKNCKIPKDVIAKIPKGVELTYWDYYHKDEDFYLDYIRKHRAFGSEPLMASGVWTWSKFWYDRRLTEAHAGACIDACRKAKLKEILFTLWGDGGAYCDFDSALAGLAFCAEKSYSDAFSEKRLAARFRAVCGADYKASMVASELECADGDEHMSYPYYFFWEDPLLAVNLSEKMAAEPGLGKRLERHYGNLSRKLCRYGHDAAAGRISHAQLLAETMSVKVGLTSRLFSAYRERNRKKLLDVRKEIPGLVRLLEQVAESLRSIWMERNKPFGFEVLQRRMAGMIVRFLETDRRLAEYLEGKSKSIPELDANIYKDGKSPVTL